LSFLQVPKRKVLRPSRRRAWPFCLAAVATIAVVQKFWNVKSSVHSGRINDVCGRVGGGLRSERVAQNDLAFVELPVRDPLVVTAATRSTGLQVRSDLRDGPAPIIMSAVLRKLISKTGGNPGPECNRRLRTGTRGSPRRTCGSSPRCGKRRCVCLDVRDPTSGAPAALNRACRKGHRRCAVVVCLSEGHVAKMNLRLQSGRRLGCRARIRFGNVRQIAIDEDWSALRFRRNEFIERPWQ